MTKSIIVTVAVQLPYSNELLNYNDKLNSAVLDVLKDGKFACSVVAGNDLTSEHPINKSKDNG